MGPSLLLLTTNSYTTLIIVLGNFLTQYTVAFNVNMNSGLNNTDMIHNVLRKS